MLVCSHHSHWLLKRRAVFLLRACDFDIGRREAGWRSGRAQARGRAPEPLTAFQNAQIKGGLTAAHLTLKTLPKLQCERHMRQWLVLIVSLSPENWFGFSLSHFFFLEKPWLPLCDKFCLFKYKDCTLGYIYHAYFFCLFLFCLIGFGIQRKKRKAIYCNAVILYCWTN